MTQFIKLCYRNILETATVTVTSENTLFPKYRLYNRDIGKLFKGNSTPSIFKIVIDQGTVISYEVDRLLIPAGHNLSGLALKLQYSANNFGILTITLGSGGSGYIVNDVLTIVQSGASGGTATVTAISTIGPIGSIALGAGGSGYTVNDVLTIVQGGASGGTATVTSVDAGVITGISLTTPGTNYSVANGLATTGGTGTGATINVTAILAAVTGISLATPGTDYSVANGLATTGGTGTGATINVTAILAAVTGISLATPGTDYSVANGLATTGGTGTGATINITAVDINDALSWTQSGSGLIDKEFTGQIKRYWRLNIANPAAAPEFAEMFLTKSYTFQTNPNYGLGEGDDKNVEDVDSQSGRWRGVKWGEYKRYRRYELTKIQTAQKEDFQTWDRHCEGIKALYLEDHEGDLFFARLLNKRLLFAMTNEGRWATDGAIEFLEVL